MCEYQTGREQNTDKFQIQKLVFNDSFVHKLAIMPKVPYFFFRLNDNLDEFQK